MQNLTRVIVAAALLSIVPTAAALPDLSSAVSADVSVEVDASGATSAAHGLVADAKASADSLAADAQARAALAAAEAKAEAEARAEATESGAARAYAKIQGALREVGDFASSIRVQIEASLFARLG